MTHLYFVISIIVYIIYKKYTCNHDAIQCLSDLINSKFIKTIMTEWESRQFIINFLYHKNTFDGIALTRNTILPPEATSSVDNTSSNSMPMEQKFFTNDMRNMFTGPSQIWQKLFGIDFKSKIATGRLTGTIK